MNKTPDSNRIRILCVDDEQNMLYSLQRTLGRYFQVQTALSGREALQKLAQDSIPFTVVISDYNMPGMNGIDLLKAIHEISPDTVLIMLTGSTELDIAIKTVNETDIFHFLAKPCSGHLLRQTVNEAIEHFQLIASKKKLNAELIAANQRLANKKQQLEHELELAKTIFGKIMARHTHNVPGLDVYIAAMENVGGDLILSHWLDGNTLYLMLGDITGHGLPAALAAMPVADAFEASCLAGYDVESMAQAINEKMCNTLPAGLFCAAILVRVDLQKQTLSVWQGGLPDAYLLDGNGVPVAVIQSGNLPLGIVAEQHFTGTAQHYLLTSFRTLFACSDGVTEKINQAQEMFGEKRLLIALKDTPTQTKRMDYLLRQIDTFCAGMRQTDDLSLFELDTVQLVRTLAT